MCPLLHWTLFMDTAITYSQLRKIKLKKLNIWCQHDCDKGGYINTQLNGIIVDINSAVEWCCPDKMHAYQNTSYERDSPMDGWISSCINLMSVWYIHTAKSLNTCRYSDKSKLRRQYSFWRCVFSVWKAYKMKTTWSHYNLYLSLCIYTFCTNNYKLSPQTCQLSRFSWDYPDL